MRYHCGFIRYPRGILLPFPCSTAMKELLFTVILVHFRVVSSNDFLHVRHLSVGNLHFVAVNYLEGGKHLTRIFTNFQQTFVDTWQEKGGLNHIIGLK